MKSYKSSKKKKKETALGITRRKQSKKTFRQKVAKAKGNIGTAYIIGAIVLVTLFGVVLMGGTLPSVAPPNPGSTQVAIQTPFPSPGQQDLQLQTFNGVTVTPSPIPSGIIPLVSPSITQNTSALPTAVKGFDTDNTVLSQAFFTSMAGDGFKVWISDSISYGSECSDGNCTHPSTTCTPYPGETQMIQYALSAGLEVGIFNRNPECWSQGLNSLGSTLSNVKFYILDIETDPGVAPTQAMVQGVEALGIQPVVYSGAGMWPTITGNSTAFSSLPLQDTNVTGNVTYANWVPSLLTPTPQQFGGWNVPDSNQPTGYDNLRVMVQQAFNITLFGQQVDLDSVNSNWLEGIE